MGKDQHKYPSGSKQAYWAEMVSKCRNSGMTVKAWCKQEGISEKAYYYWQRKVIKEKEEAEERFIEVARNKWEAPEVVAAIKTRGIQVEIHRGVDRETMITLLQAIQTC